MNLIQNASALILGATLVFALTTTAPAADSTPELLAQVRAADGSAQSDRAAAAAVSQLQSLPSSNVVDVLRGFSGASKRGLNWLRSLAADVSDNGDFQADALLGFYQDRTNDPAARYVAFQLLVQNEGSRKASLLKGAETDPSLPIRYLRIQGLFDEASKLADSDASAAQKLLRSVVANARSPKQLDRAAKLLDEQGVDVDLASELAVIRSWKVVGPFDNTDSEDFDTAYTPEQRYLGSGNPVAGAEKGKTGSVEWRVVSSEDRMGMVDLNEPLENEKDGLAYCFATFTVAGDDVGSAQARLGCINANKVWVNGKLVSSNEVYHSGSRIDQYIGECELVRGQNTVLIKVLQNAQTQPWAQDWEFQFRFTRGDGSAIPVQLTTPQ